MSPSHPSATTGQRTDGGPTPAADQYLRDHRGAGNLDGNTAFVRLDGDIAISYAEGNKTVSRSLFWLYVEK
ncbi:hypothetical protein E3T55_06855 [Cryobacterium frigoriphilum]|uniref:Uncharacterized protein n=1 Tax=Cryobacterium frigoriphilum TaxID=1259150 RepID=A0A4R9A4P2_9MICO|nr:hypothetical protein [Cryobacterium frigoriphilum]TFD52176.1 hypothetical protein E3T55_06855 [Cryobacterium frigoriphilum]